MFFAVVGRPTNNIFCLSLTKVRKKIKIINARFIKFCATEFSPLLVARPTILFCLSFENAVVGRLTNNTLLPVIHENA